MTAIAFDEAYVSVGTYPLYASYTDRNVFVCMPRAQFYIYIYIYITFLRESKKYNSMMSFLQNMTRPTAEKTALKLKTDCHLYIKLTRLRALQRVIIVSVKCCNLKDSDECF